MATVVLQTVGAVVGGAIGGPFGAILGRAAGAAAGYAIDQTYLAKDQVIQGPRLDGSRILSAIEGAPIPKIYGRNRISGQIIWATRFEEVASTQKRGGKGTGNSSSTTSFSYFANFAIGLCEGSVSGVRRIWADGKELDLTKIEFRFYDGNESQEADPLIEAKQGIGKTPAFRGTAYIVFENLALEDYGNRIPQLSFEIVRSIGSLEKNIKSITVIPGSTEFGYDTELIATGGGEETYNARNRHVSVAMTDWEASIDELQMVCPNLESVSLVVSWFGTDLRAGECKILPGVTTRIGGRWQVNNLRRNEAHLVSQVSERPAFGGTPDDSSIIRAIKDLKSRGLKVVLYPFIMMDIPSSNGLPDLSGEGEQAVYPWRGEISCYPSPGSENSADKTSQARMQLDTFDEQYHKLIIHYANLCSEAGGVSGFLIGSELRGLTRVRDEDGKFPFVETLIRLSSECRQILSSETKITYGADWSEYFGYQPQDGSGDVLFNLDSFWAAPDIDSIGIDNYMPLSDWRDEGDIQNPKALSSHSLEYLQSNIAAEEGYDWYYRSYEDRVNYIRTPITDGFGEPWVFRYKDLEAWWSNPHHNRINGNRETEPTAWIPKSKPFTFTELGCPAVDKGTNQPNVFYDPKSAQSSLPYFSSGGRDDLIQRRYLEAQYDFWTQDENNPRSDKYQGRMLEIDSMTPWAWDARPFPWFPLQLDTWSDGDNWYLGHWLTGRLGGCSLQDLVLQILKDFGYDDINVKLDGIIDGYLIPNQTSARAALEPLLALHNIQVSEEGGQITIQDRAYADHLFINNDILVHEENEFETTLKRGNDLELPSEAVITHGSVFGDYEETATKSRRLEGHSDRQISLQAPIILPETTAHKLADTHLREGWVGREEAVVKVPICKLALANGDIINFSDSDGKKWRVNQVERNLSQTVSLSSVVELPKLSAAQNTKLRANIIPNFFGKPNAILLDLPLLKASDQNKSILHLAVEAMPWAGSYSVLSSFEEDGFSNRTVISSRATIGKLCNQFGVGPSGRWDYDNVLLISLHNGSLESASHSAVLNGANIIALESSNGNYELLQFTKAELQSDGKWKLSQLLRAQLGTEPELEAGTFIGANVIILDAAIYPLEMSDNEAGVQQNWRLGPAGDNVADETYINLSHTYRSRSTKMLSPVHLKSVKTISGDHQITWIRRGTLNADSWEGTDISLEASPENYDIKFIDSSGALKRQVTSAIPSFMYTKDMFQTDIANHQDEIEIQVSQFNKSGQPGFSEKIILQNT